MTRYRVDKRAVPLLGTWDLSGNGGFGAAARVRLNAIEDQSPTRIILEASTRGFTLDVQIGYTEVLYHWAADAEL